MALSSANAVAAAIDLGTTGIAASLIDPFTGERLAMVMSPNPQRRFGTDVVARLASAVASRSVRREMASLANAELERLVRQLLEESGRGADSLGRVAIAGNPAMEHLLLDMPVDSLARIPYRPLFTQGRTIDTAALGWGVGVEAYLFPLPGGFVGGDLVAFLYGQGGFDSPPREPRLFLDIGTNAEIALTIGDRIFATSAAAGPAFEGGNLSCGMPAAPGAIDSVSIRDDRVAITTVAGVPPQGVCGTGALSAVVSLLEAGGVDMDGRLLPARELTSNLANRVMEQEGGEAFVLYRDASRELVITQNDVRQLQLAKGAIRAGIEVLASRAGTGWGSISEVVVSGMFGSTIRGEWLETLGVVADGMADRVTFVADGVLTGVERAISRLDPLTGIDLLAERLRIVPLSGNPAFEQEFLKHIDFPSMR